MLSEKFSCLLAVQWQDLGHEDDEDEDHDDYVTICQTSELRRREQGGHWSCHTMLPRISGKRVLDSEISAAWRITAKRWFETHWQANQDLCERAVFREIPNGGRVGCFLYFSDADFRECLA